MNFNINFAKTNRRSIQIFERGIFVERIKKERILVFKISKNLFSYRNYEAILDYKDLNIIFSKK